MPCGSHVFRSSAFLEPGAQVGPGRRPGPAASATAAGWQHPSWIGIRHWSRRPAGTHLHAPILGASCCYPLCGWSLTSPRPPRKLLCLSATIFLNHRGTENTEAATHAYARGPTLRVAPFSSWRSGKAGGCPQNSRYGSRLFRCSRTRMAAVGAPGRGLAFLCISVASVPLWFIIISF